MRRDGVRVRWWELPIVAAVLALGLLSAAPGRPDAVAALVSGALGALVYGTVWLLPTQRPPRAP